VPIALSIALEAVFSAQISGLKATRNHSSSRAVRTTVTSAWVMEKIFGTCSPTVMCSAVVMK
jgi:hypothetical protein